MDEIEALRLEYENKITQLTAERDTIKTDFESLKTILDGEKENTSKLQKYIAENIVNRDLKKDEKNIVTDFETLYKEAINKNKKG